MNTTLAYPDRRAAWLTRCGHWIELTKPKIALLELLTVVAAAFVASSGMPSDMWLVVHAVVGTALVAGSASALNQWLERDTDRRMPRTAGRPLPAGHLADGEVLAFASVTVVVGTIYLALLVGLLTAAVGLVTWALYVAVYTPLKTRSSSNTLVGAVAGAGPVLMGWTAVQPGFDTRENLLLAVTLFLIVFLWQFPHFMAIAWIYRKQYRTAGAKMLTVVDPTGRLAGFQALLCAALLVPVSLLPSVIMRAGPVYFVCVLLLSLAQLGTAAAFLRRPSDRSARRMLRASLGYLPALLTLLILAPFVFPRL